MNPSDKPTDFSRTQRPDEAWLARAVPEPAIEPDLPIIDAHMHLWHHPTGYRYFVEEYAQDVAVSGHNVEATIYVECRSMYRKDGPEHLKSLGETEFAAGMAAIAASGKYTSSKVAAGIIANADLRLGAQLDELLDAHIDMANGRLRGIRNGAKWDPDPRVKGPVSADRPGLYLDEALHRGLRLLPGKGLIFEASVFHPQIPEVAQMARAAPDTQIVLIHTGSPVGHSSYAGRQQQVLSDWLASMRELARCPNVTVKLGGLLMPLANFDFGVAGRPPTSEELVPLWRPYIEPCLEHFGAQRCTIGSNFPVEKAGVAYGALLNTFKRITAGCSRSEREALFGGTARRLYRL
jgi:L-fuconolactonase